MSSVKLDPSNFNLSAKQARQEWHCLVPDDTLVEDVLKPVYWVHVMSKLKPGALVDLLTRDGTLDMQVRVLAIQNGNVIVRPRIIVQAEGRDKRVKAMQLEQAQQLGRDGFELQAEIRAVTPDGYKVGFNPGKKNWYVQLKADGSKLYADIMSRDKALELAIAHAKAAGVEVKEPA
jgi:hypothetical protein